jgi:hypothetical protein
MAGEYNVESLVRGLSKFLASTGRISTSPRVHPG